MRKNTIYMVGPSLATKGGISSVLAYYKANLSERFPYRFIASYSGESRLLDFVLFGLSFLRVLFLAVINPSAVFHIHASTGGSFLRKAILLRVITMAGRTCILHIHGADYDSFIDHASARLLKYILRFLRGADAIIVLSRSWQEYFSKYVEPDKLFVVNNPAPIILERLKAGSTSEPLHMVFTGLIGHRKGAFDIIEALAGIPGEGWTLDMFGNGEVKQLRQRIQEMHLNDRIHVFEWMRHEDLMARYVDYQVQLLPSWAEGQPMSLLEGLGSGLALIASRVGGIPELLDDGENGIFVSPGNTAEIQEAIERCLAHRDMVETMRNNSLRKAKDLFSREAVTTQMLRVYRHARVDV